MDERRLTVFLAIVETGGVTKAAAQLRVAQPSVSQTLRALERECGVDLFHRVGRGIRLTAAGEAFIAPARQALRSLRAAAEAAAQVGALNAGTLEIGSLSTLAIDPLPRLVGQFRKRYEQVVVRVHEPEGVFPLSELVRDGTCEIGLTHLPALGRGLQSRTLGWQGFLLVLPPRTHRLPDPLPVEALGEIPLVVPPEGTSTRILLDQALAEIGVVPIIAVETAAREGIVGLVLAGAGAALLPSTIARDATAMGAIARRLTPSLTREIGLIHRDNPLSAAAEAFLDSAVSPSRVAAAA